MTPICPSPCAPGCRESSLHITLQLNDDKHRKLEQILDTTRFLQRICNNLREHPAEPKFRKVRVAATNPSTSMQLADMQQHPLQIRITNPTFVRHVRDAPGGEEYMRAAGWKPAVMEHEKHFVFEHQPGGLEWRILEEACAELDKLAALVDGKMKVWEGWPWVCRLQPASRCTHAGHAARHERQEGGAGTVAAAGAGRLGR